MLYTFNKIQAFGAFFNSSAEKVKTEVLVLYFKTKWFSYLYVSSLIVISSNCAPPEKT